MSATTDLLGERIIQNKIKNAVDHRVQDLFVYELKYYEEKINYLKNAHSALMV